MRWIWLALGLCACGPSAGSIEHPKYRPVVDSDSWCRLGEGAYAFVPRPQVSPPLAGSDCAAPRRVALPERDRSGSTLAELVVEPGASIEIPVLLPAALREVGCRLDSVLIPHGKRSSDVAIELAIAERMLPVVSYAQLPPPLQEGVSPPTVSDSPDLRRALWVPDAPAGGNDVASIADPELWPTGAVLKFDGGRLDDGAASVVFEIERTSDEAAEDPTANATANPTTNPTDPTDPTNPTVPAKPAGPSPAPPVSGTAPVGPWPPIGPVPTPVGPTPAPIGPSPGPIGPSTAPIGPSPGPVGPSPAPGERSPSSEQTEPTSEQQAEPRARPERQPGLLELIPYRHRVGIVAPDSFSIVLRAREKPFGIGVRSDRESPDPTLKYRSAGASEPAATHLVPLVVVVVSRCGRPITDVLRDIK
jgi:hypothetical protein